MKNIKTLINSTQWNSIQGWFDYPNIYDMAVKQQNKDAIFVEIGAWFGKSTSYMAQKIADYNSIINFYVVDTWEGAEESKTQKGITQKYNNNIFNMFWQNMIDCGVQQYIKPIQLESTKAAQSFDNESIDFAFIDASHLYKAVLADVKSWYPKIKAGGIIAGHDYDERFGVVQAVNEFFLSDIEIISPQNNKISDSWLHVKKGME